jgi:hypothetical protein
MLTVPKAMLSAARSQRQTRPATVHSPARRNGHRRPSDRKLFATKVTQFPTEARLLVIRVRRRTRAAPPLWASESRSREIWIQGRVDCFTRAYDPPFLPRLYHSRQDTMRAEKKILEPLNSATSRLSDWTMVGTDTEDIDVHKQKYDCEWAHQSWVPTRDQRAYCWLILRARLKMCLLHRPTSPSARPSSHYTTFRVTEGNAALTDSLLLWHAARTGHLGSSAGT